ncbi:MAG TPA: BREX system P-loop protein BrxC [Kosmotogaceae bacterium]|nr:MAG: Uncharacterized protein XE05_1214 [Thermotogales bacterium 46_20]HAA86448.1 BREX system P-loop protein BrxC [Kosmotogaceae bacterium]
MPVLKSVFVHDIEQETPLVVKTEVKDTQQIMDEISQYIVTRQIENHLEVFLQEYLNPSTEKIGSWISGFFGSGKSYFAKIIGYLLKNETLPNGLTAREHFMQRLVGCDKRDFIKGQLDALAKVPTETIIFEIVAESSMGNERVSQVLFKKLMEHVGYSSYPRTAVMEYEMSRQNYLQPFKDFLERQGDIYDQVVENTGEFRKHAEQFLVQERDFTQEQASEFLKDAVSKFNSLTAADFARHCVDYAKRVNKRLTFIVDEMGQYVTSEKSDDRILELQGVIHQLSTLGKGAVRLVVTAQEKLDNLVSDQFDKRKRDKLIDRFEVRLDLTSENVDQVAREKLLYKKTDSKPLFEEIFSKNEGNLATMSNTKSSYPSLRSVEKFMEYYPFFEYHFRMLPDLIQSSTRSTYAAATPRRFVFIVDHILKRLKEEQVGRVVNAVDLFDALGTAFFGSGIVSQCESVDKDFQATSIKASDIMKTLEITRRLDHIRADYEVVTRLLTKTADQKQHVLQKDVTEMIKALERGRYVSVLDGEISIVTDVERELIELIEKQTVAMADIDKEIVKNLRDIVNLKEVRHTSDAPSIPVGWEYKTTEFISRRGGIRVQIRAFGSVVSETLEAESVSKHDTVYVIAAQQNAVEQAAREALKLEQALNEFRRMRTDLPSREIMDRYGKVLEERKRSLSSHIRSALDKGVTLYHGTQQSLQVSLVESVKRVIAESVIPSLYSSITSYSASRSDVDHVLTFQQKKLHEIRRDPDHEVFEPSGELIDTHKIISPVRRFLSEPKKGSDILAYFCAPPYGWAETTICYALAALMRSGKLEVNGIDAYNDEKVRRVLTTPSELKDASIRLTESLSIADKQKLIDVIRLINPDSSIHLSAAKSTIAEELKVSLSSMIERMKNVEQRFKEIGAECDLKTANMVRLRNILQGAYSESLQDVIALTAEIKEAHESLQQSEELLNKSFSTYRSEASFLNELRNEIQKRSFTPDNEEIITSLVSEYEKMIKEPLAWEKRIHEVFGEIRQEYFKQFKIAHSKRNETAKELSDYLENIADKQNKLGDKASEQDWFIKARRKVSKCCEEPEIEFSTSCKNCRYSLKELLLEEGNLVTLLSETQRYFKDFMAKKDEPDNGRETTLTLKSTMRVSDLREKISNLSDDTTVHLRLED